MKDKNLKGRLLLRKFLKILNLLKFLIIRRYLVSSLRHFMAQLIQLLNLKMLKFFKIWILLRRLKLSTAVSIEDL